MKIVGIDLSLTSTGIATIDTTTGARAVATVTSKGKAGASLESRQTRLHNLCLDVVAGRGGAHDADLVVIEAPAFSRSNPGMHDRSGLWWLVVDMLDGFDRPIVEVSPSSRAKYGSGKGNAGKDQVLAAVVRRYPDIPVSNNDEADALILAAMGARHLGHPIEVTLPQVQLDAMVKVRWPELVAS